ncbi:hypothetical protein EFD55_16960 [Rhizobium pisi]|uniref:Uncharacterized protein n=2 Tax=Rhizobium TaxID=379 RepID=A0ABY0B8T2_9HYPH|nr:hypothetical protein EFD55_16960 [Rhizobium pisi]RUM12381.1 hypothetical protein EFB14_13800 [Rhizobium fabae]TCA58948.1 hypothetical protein E0J16_11330 [Rhizobium pisi]
MLGYGFQLVNAKRPWADILGGMTSRKRVFDAMRMYLRRSSRCGSDFAILLDCLRFFRPSEFSFVTMPEIIRCVPESNASPTLLSQHQEPGSCTRFSEIR